MEVEIRLTDNNKELFFPTSTDLNRLTEDQLRDYLDEYKNGDFWRADYVLVLL